MNEIQRHLERVRRSEREALDAFLDGALTGDAAALHRSFIGLDNTGGWCRALRRAASLNGACDRARLAFLATWVRDGDHIRTECNDDLILLDALRNLLPRYAGPALTLYRGDSAFNRRRRTYGMAWSENAETADSFARGVWRTFQGGSVLLQVEARSEAIICAPALLGDDYGEGEFILDRRRLRCVRVLRRHSQISFAERAAECGRESDGVAP